MGHLAQGLKNKRFKETEEKILWLFFDSGGRVSVAEMAQKIGVARSTIYRHHRKLEYILEDYEKLLVEDYREKFRLHREALDKIFLNSLVYIMANKTIFLIFLAKHDDFVFYEIIKTMKKKIMRNVSGVDKDRIFMVYAGEVVAVIKQWGERGFLGSEVMDTLNDIMLLTNSISARLSFFR